MEKEVKKKKGDNWKLFFGLLGIILFLLACHYLILPLLAILLLQKK
jgi:thiol:disulfide interchange protein